MRALAALALALAAVAVVAAAPGCTAETSARCRQVCARQNECENQKSSESAETAFDEGECVAACAALERDNTTQGMVKSHAECVNDAGADCPALLKCR